jgi:hypothetical protein
MAAARATDAPRTKAEFAAKAAFEAFCKGRPNLEACSIENAQDTVRDGEVRFATAEYWGVALRTAERMADEVAG